MALVESALRSSIFGMTSNPSSSKDDAVSRWTDALHSYFSGAIAGATAPTNLIPATIRGSLLSSMFGDFYVKLGIGVDLYWRSAVWVGPGFTGVTLSSTGLGPMLVSKIPELMSLGDDRERAASIISSTIHSFTKSITVVVTNVTSGATSVVSLT